MKASKLLWAVVMALTFVLTSCDPFSKNEPTIEGDRYKYFDSSAQRQSFRVVNGSGKQYNRKVDWHIIGIQEENSDTYLTKKVDTLSNGDFRISYDWVTFTAKENKSVIDVEVQKNETGKDRSVFFATSNSYKQAYLPNMIVTQRAK
jgi:lipoprotein